MYAGDERLKTVNVRMSTRIVLFWTLWTKYAMPFNVAIRTFFN